MIFAFSATLRHPIYFGFFVVLTATASGSTAQPIEPKTAFGFAFGEKREAIARKWKLSSDPESSYKNAYRVNAGEPTFEQPATPLTQLLPNFLRTADARTTELTLYFDELGALWRVRIVAGSGYGNAFDGAAAVAAFETAVESAKQRGSIAEQTNLPLPVTPQSIRSRCSHLRSNIAGEAGKLDLEFTFQDWASNLSSRSDRYAGIAIALYCTSERPSVRIDSGAYSVIIELSNQGWRGVPFGRPSLVFASCRPSPRYKTCEAQYAAMKRKDDF